MVGSTQTCVTQLHGQSNAQQTASSIPAVAETMERLSSKSGVIATMAIERSSSSILSFKGTLSTVLTGSQEFAPSSNAAPAVALSPTTTTSVLTTNPSAASALGDASVVSSADSAVTEFAQMIWQYVETTGKLISGMDTEVRTQFQMITPEGTITDD